MKKCIIITLLVTTCSVQMSSAMSSIRSNVKDYLQRYKNAYGRMANVNHTNFSQAKEEGQRLGLMIQQCEMDLKAVNINDFSPSKDSPEEYADKLSDEQLDAFGKRFQ